MLRAKGASVASVAASSAHRVAAGISDSIGEPYAAKTNAASRAGLRNYSILAANSTQTKSVFHASWMLCSSLKRCLQWMSRKRSCWLIMVTLPVTRHATIAPSKTTPRKSISLRFRTTLLIIIRSWWRRLLTRLHLNESHCSLMNLGVKRAWGQIPFRKPNLKTLMNAGIKWALMPLYCHKLYLKTLPPSFPGAHLTTVNLWEIPGLWPLHLSIKASEVASVTRKIKMKRILTIMITRACNE